MIYPTLLLAVVCVVSHEVSSTCDHTSPLQELITDNEDLTDVHFKEHTVNEDNICLLIEAFETKKVKWRKLDLWNNDLGPDGAIHINRILQISKLVYIHLGRNSLGYIGLQRLTALKDNHHLSELDLWDNHIGDQGMNFLAEILPTTQLAKLNLGVNGIGDKGCQVLFKNLPISLIELNLYANRIGQTCLSSIIDAISKGHLKVLNLEAQSNEWNTKNKEELINTAKLTDVWLQYR